MEREEEEEEEGEREEEEEEEEEEEKGELSERQPLVREESKVGRPSAYAPFTHPLPLTHPHTPPPHTHTQLRQSVAVLSAPQYTS